MTLFLSKKEKRRFSRFKPKNEDRFTAEEEREFKVLERLMKKSQRRAAATGILAGALLLAAGIRGKKAYKHYKSRK